MSKWDWIIQNYCAVTLYYAVIATKVTWQKLNTPATFTREISRSFAPFFNPTLSIAYSTRKHTHTHNGFCRYLGQFTLTIVTHVPSTQFRYVIFDFIADSVSSLHRQILSSVTIAHCTSHAIVHSRPKDSSPARVCWVEALARLFCSSFSFSSFSFSIWLRYSCCFFHFSQVYSQQEKIVNKRKT